MTNFVVAVNGGTLPSTFQIGNLPAETRMFCEAGALHRNGITAIGDLEHVRKMGRQRSTAHLDRFSFLESTWGTAQTLMLKEGIWNAVIKLAETLHRSDIK
jgi:hypothetical protein